MNENYDNNEMNEQNNSAPEPQSSHPNVYTVGSTSGGTEQSYTPPTSPNTERPEYSYTRESIPEYRYAYTQPSAPAPEQDKKTKKKKKRSGHGGLIALVIVAAVLLCMLAGLGGALIVRLMHMQPNDNTLPIETTDPGKVNSPVDSAADTSSPTDGSMQAPLGDAANAIIIKNDDSVTVKTVSGQVGDEALSIPDVVALVRDSVVEIYTEIPTYNGRFIKSGAGSGVIYSKTEDGKIAYVVTNNHVIAGADTITVRLTNGNKYIAKLCGTDASSDVAVLAIEVTEEITVAQMGSSKGLVVGEAVIAIGNPLGELGGTVTNGIISALARDVEIDGQAMTLLQTNAAVNPGNSGGGLFNMKGELIGVVNAKSGGDSVENIGFAIPVDTAYNIVKELMTYGYVTGRVDSGLTLIDVTDTYSAWYYGVSSLGVYVYESKYTDEIKSGDRIVSVNGTEVSTSADVKSALSECKVGETITVRISRSGKQSDVQLTLQEYVPTLTTQEK